jgi:hypothetical protein
MRFMFRFWAIVFFCLFWRQAGAQPGLPENFRNEVRRAQNTPSCVSVSGQFIVHGAPAEPWRLMGLSSSLAKDYVRLDAPLLAVSCERIKSALLSDLGAQDQWQSRVAVFLHQAHRLDEPVVIGSSANQGEWTYYMNLPDTVDRTRLVSAFVNMTLLEMANRGAQRSAEIPTWLAQGLTQQLTHETVAGLVMESPKEGNHDIHTSSELLEGRSVPPLEQAHAVLQAHPPLSLSELSWPRDGQEESEVYRCSAQLFVSRLLQLDDGRACLRQMIQELPRHLNWQISLLNAFHKHFASELDLEKWWALCVVNFTGRDLAQTWPHAESWQKLGEVVHTGAQVRTAVDEMPLHTEVTLQNVIADWGYAMQEGVLRVKIRQLGQLRDSVSQDLAGLVDDYRLVLVNYVSAREKSGAFRNTTAQRVLGPDQLALDTIRQLNALDAEREAMKIGPETTGQTANNNSINH